MSKVDQIVVNLSKDTDGSVLRQLRERAHMSRADLVHELRVAGLKVDMSTIVRWERGETAPTTPKARRLAEVFARYAGNWPKASNLSPPQPGYAFRRTPVLELTPA